MKYGLLEAKQNPTVEVNNSNDKFDDKSLLSSSEPATIEEPSNPPVLTLTESIVSIATPALSQVNNGEQSETPVEIVSATRIPPTLIDQILPTTNQLDTSVPKSSQDAQEAQDAVPISTHESNTQQSDVVVTERKQDFAVCTVMEVTDSNTEQQQAIEMDTTDEKQISVEMDTQEPLSPQTDVDMSDVPETEFAKSSVVYHFENAPIIELSRYSWGRDEQKYLRGCIFSPDGTCILTTVNLDGMHVVELPLSLYDNETVTQDRPLDVLTSAVHIREAGTVYDYCWYPFMNSTMPETCCFISSRKNDPLQLWDAFDGQLRCSYRGYDAVDEIDAALSVCFSIDGSQVIGGYKKSLKIFRTDIPGRDYTNFSLKSPASCLAVHSADENVIAIGSWNTRVTIHDIRTPKLTVIDSLVKHTGGVTLMKFMSDGKRLITGARRDNKLLAWDIRNATEPLFSLARNVETNQKIYFDIDWSEEWLISGDTHGIVHAYNLKCGMESGRFPDYQYKLHNDCCNGVSLHPSRSILATCSGQHHFIGIDDEIALKPAAVQENSLIFWWCGNPD